jgi:hypothetical protein
MVRTHKRARRQTGVHASVPHRLMDLLQSLLIWISACYLLHQLLPYRFTSISVELLTVVVDEIEGTTSLDLKTNSHVCQKHSQDDILGYMTGKKQMASPLQSTVP